MEVINCFEVSSYSPRKTTRTRAVAVSRLPARPKRFSENSEDYGKAVKKIFRKSNGLGFSVKTLAGNVLYTAKTVKSASKFLVAVPLAAAVLSVPLTSLHLFSMTKSHVRVLDMSVTRAAENEFIDGLMSSFAMDRISYYDSEGNVFDQDSNRVISAGRFSEPVTFQNYTVKPGETISGICSRFGLSNISTLIAVNGISNVRSVYSGQKLRIPSMDGLVHVVSRNESVSSIASKYNVGVSAILDVNDLSSDVLVEKQKLFIPGARLDAKTLQNALGEFFGNPLKSSYRISSRFGFRHDPITGVATSHKGLDLACPTGTPIYASKSGTVARAGFTPLYGNYVLVNHGEGYQTLYAHMSKILVKKNDAVNQSTKVGLVGSTGYSTGPHLHFTVYKNSVPVDPQTVVRGKF